MLKEDEMSKFRVSVGFTLLLVAVSLLSSCTYFPPIKGVPTQHIVMVESNGRLIDPTGTVRCRTDRLKDDNEAFIAESKKKHPTTTVLPPAKYNWKPCNGRFHGLWLRELDRSVGHGKPPVLDGEPYLDDLFKAMDDFHANRKPGEPRKVVIFIHGGLNNNVSTIKRARDTAEAMRRDGVYPVFLNWQSNLVGSLWEHLMNVRQGDHKGYRHFYLFPFYLAADLARGVGRAPATWFYMSGNGADRVRHVVQKQAWSFDETYCRMRRAYEACAGGTNCNEIAISKGPEVYGTLETTRAAIRGTATGLVPARYVLKAIGGGWSNPAGWLAPKALAAPILDGLGGPAWDTMLRHATVPFHSDGVANPDREVMKAFGDVRYPEGGGGFSRFFRRLKSQMEQCKPNGEDRCGDWEITIIGHSMGAIVLKPSSS